MSEDKERALLTDVFVKADVLLRTMDQHSLAAARSGSYRGDAAVVKQAQRLHNAVESVFEWKRRKP